MEKERITDKIQEIGKEGEDKAKEFLFKNGYLIFNDKEIERLLIKYGQNLQISKLYKKIKNSDKLLEAIKKVESKYYLTMYLMNEKGEYEKYAVNQIKVFEELGCVLSDKEKEYLKENNIFKIGDLTGIKEKKLTCFEIKTSQKEYWQSGMQQFEENCMAGRSEIDIKYVLINYTGNPEKIEIINIKDLWFNWHTASFNLIHQPINIIRKTEAIAKKNRYYSNTFVQFEIIKSLKNRELALLNNRIDLERKNLRFLLAFNLDYLRKHFRRFDFDKSLTNLYHSVALLKPSVPVFSYNWKERRKDEKYQEFNENYKNYIEGYNLFIDIDADWNWKQALQDALEIKKIFDEYKVPYYVLNSSYKGFHFHIPAEYMPKMEIFELLQKINKAVYNIKGIYDLQAIDTSIFDMKRVCKVPYSLSSDGAICLPLNDEQLKNYTPEMVKMENVMRTIKIMNRGLLTRTYNLSEEELKENVKKFISEFQ